MNEGSTTFYRRGEAGSDEYGMKWKLSGGSFELRESAKFNETSRMSLPNETTKKFPTKCLITATMNKFLNLHNYYDKLRLILFTLAHLHETFAK